MNPKLLRALVLLSSIFLTACFLLFRSGFFNDIIYGRKKSTPVNNPVAKSPLKKDSLILQVPASSFDDNHAEMFSSSKSMATAIRIQDIIRFDSLADIFILEPKEKMAKSGKDISINEDSIDAETSVVSQEDSINFDTTGTRFDTIRTFPKLEMKQKPTMMSSSKLGIVFTPADFKESKAMILYRQRKDSSTTKKEHSQ